jgi:hypothetical protein
LSQWNTTQANLSLNRSLRDICILACGSPTHRQRAAKHVAREQKTGWEALERLLTGGIDAFLISHFVRSGFLGFQWVAGQSAGYWRSRLEKGGPPDQQLQRRQAVHLP